MAELSKGAKIAVETCMGVKPNETVLIVTHPPRLRIAEALVKAARAAKAETVLMCMRVLSSESGRVSTSMAPSCAR